MNEQYQGGNKFYTAPIQNTDNLDPNKAPIDNGYPAYQKSSPWKTALIAGARARMPGKAQAARYYAQQERQNQLGAVNADARYGAVESMQDVENDPFIKGNMEAPGMITDQDIINLQSDIINDPLKGRVLQNKLQFQGGVSPMQRLQQKQ